ncbi:hypothetical protein [Roseateles oligotrophus]|uniref:Lipoprotein n=1 Tax=Roseateles oligotrophus TaxID=1769250 RepID=A0ABT2YM70_9BURK|nr:hypothetical protein [Roseateles oligotrophus]MCV2371160.1 hypothetical protein [Roseateles oligotrophus]
MKVNLLAGHAPLVSLLAVAALSACGGGGSSSTTNEPASATPVPEKALSLTSSNYQSASQQALSAGNYLLNSGDLLNGAQAGAAPSALGVAVKQLPGLLKQFKRPALLAGAVISDSKPCSDGGKIDFTLTDSNNNGLPDEGESVVMVANACKEGSSLMAGRIEISMSKLSGVFDSTNFSATIGMKLDNFSVTTPTSSSIGKGELKLSIASSSATQTSLQIEAPNFSSSGRMGALEYQQTMTGFVISISTTTQANGQSTDSAIFRGTFSSTALEGKTLSIDTPIALTMPSNLNYPTAGKLVIKGANNSVVQMTVQPNGRVLIELDADGNGSFETSVNKAWSELY